VASAELIRNKAGLGDPTDVPIFILGMPRSGSTLVEQVLASHPKVFGAGELKDFDQVVKTVFGPDGAVVAYPEFLPSFGAEHLRRMGAQYLRRLRQHSADAPRITNKMPSSFFYTGLIHLALPNARIIHTMRNPVDTCLSCFSKLFSGEQNFSYDLGELGRYYRKYTELMEHWRHALPPGVMLDVQYEEVVEDFETQARRIVAHCGLEWDEACLAFHKNKRPVKTASALQVRRPIYQSSVGRWLPYKDQLEPLLRELPIEQPA
jgi:sulfotransferase family protein